MNSIRDHLTRRLVLGAFLLLGAGWMALWLSARSALIDQFDRMLRAQAQTVAALLEVEHGALDLESPDRLPDRFRRDRPHSYYAIFDSAGHQLFGSAPSESNLPRLTPPTAATSTAFWNLPLPRDRSGRAIVWSYTVESGQPTEPTSIPLRIVVASDRDDLDEALFNYLTLSSSIAVGLLVLALYATPRVLRTGLRPLDRLGHNLGAIDASRLDWRIALPGLPTELNPIAARLNGLLERLEHAFARERRINSDLAHELRTPVAELRTVAESALAWPDQRDPQTDTDALAIAIHLQGLVDRMLDLARSEEGRLTPAPVPSDLAALATAALRPFRDRAAVRKLSFACNLPPTPVPVDPVLLRSILNNLLDNAVEHAPAGSRLQLACGDAPTPWFEISNPAPDLVPADLARLFERLWRKQAARTDSGHFGLGLPLVQNVAAAMGWSVAADLGADQRLRLRIAAHATTGSPA